MNKSELAVVKRLIGWRSHSMRNLPAPYRDVIGGRAYKVCQMLEEEGVGRIERVNDQAFVFKSHAMEDWQ